MVELEKPAFDVHAFLASAGLGRRIVQLAPRAAAFCRKSGEFHLLPSKGRAKVEIVSQAGKGDHTLLSGNFVGERGARGDVRTPVGNGHRNDRLRSAQDNAGGDDPRYARRA
jgi:hypothetical protein